jgi:hypothetical protein
LVRINDDPLENGVRPSVDYLIRSASDALSGNVLSVIMTGMGRDGLAGCKQLKQAGGYVFAQCRDDCVVYGMPKSVIDENLADRTLPLGKIAPRSFAISTAAAGRNSQATGPQDPLEHQTAAYLRRQQSSSVARHGATCPALCVKTGGASGAIACPGKLAIRGNLGVGLYFARTRTHYRSRQDSFRCRSLLLEAWTV